MKSRSRSSSTTTRETSPPPLVPVGPRGGFSWCCLLSTSLTTLSLKVSDAIESMVDGSAGRPPVPGAGPC